MDSANAHHIAGHLQIESAKWRKYSPKDVSKNYLTGNNEQTPLIQAGSNTLRFDSQENNQDKARRLSENYTEKIKQLFNPIATSFNELHALRKKSLADLTELVRLNEKIPDTSQVGSKVTIEFFRKQRAGSSTRIDRVKRKLNAIRKETLDPDSLFDADKFADFHGKLISSSTELSNLHSTESHIADKLREQLQILYDRRFPNANRKQIESD